MASAWNVLVDHPLLHGQAIDIGHAHVQQQADPLGLEKAGRDGTLQGLKIREFQGGIPLLGQRAGISPPHRGIVIENQYCPGFE